jgi:hypothetical protein
MAKMLQRLAQEQHGTGPADYLQAVLSTFCLLTQKINICLCFVTVEMIQMFSEFTRI